MPRQLQNHRITERTLIAVSVILFLFVSPLTEIWADIDAPWFAPYIVWALAIFMSWLLQRYISRLLKE